jgi:MerR family transcriptional regulator, copper efflux regulator
MPEVLYIGRVAERTGLSVHTIRFYERQGLLKPPVRSDGRFRVFGGQEVRDLRFIRRAQELGFSLTEIRELLVLRRTRPQACAHVRGLLTNALRRVDEKVADLTRLQHELQGALRKCNRDLARSEAGAEKICPVLDELDLAVTKPLRPEHPARSSSGDGRTRSSWKKIS